MTTKKTRRPTRKVKNLTPKQAKSVKGGAFQAHIIVKGTKQGKLSG